MNEQLAKKAADIRVKFESEGFQVASSSADEGSADSGCSAD